MAGSTTLTGRKLERRFDELRDDLGRRQGVSGLPRAALETLSSESKPKDFAHCCAAGRVLQGVARRAVSGVEPLSTFTWLLELLDPPREQLDAAFIGFVDLPWDDVLPPPDLDIVVDVVSRFIAAGATTGWYTDPVGDRLALDAALAHGDIREAHVRAVADALLPHTDPHDLARCALRRITRCRGRAFELADIAWLLDQDPPEDELELGLALGALLSLSDEVRTLTESLDADGTVRVGGRWALGARVVGANAGPVMVDLEAGDDAASIAGRIERRLDETVAALSALPESSTRDSRLQLAQERLAVVRGWERASPAQGPTSPMLDALARLASGHPQVQEELGLVDAGSIPLSQYLEGVEVLRRHADNLGPWADQSHPLARILGADRSALGVMSTLDPERYPAAAADVLDGVSHGMIDGVIYAYPFDGDGVQVVAVTLEEVSQLGALQAFVDDGVAALTAPG